MEAISTKKRYRLVDALRGLAVVLMVAYHTVWDLVYVHGVKLSWFSGTPRFILQRGIRWAFILIAGFCFCLGKRKCRRGLLTLGCSAVVTLVTLVVLPDYPIHFGVLCLIGSATLLTIPLEKLLKKCSPYLGFAACLLLFLLTAEGQTGSLRFCGIALCRTPQWLHRNMLTAWLGFPAPGFSSADYVPLIPWLFVFWMGFFAYEILRKHNWLDSLARPGCAPLEWLGRHSLALYMAHQPLIYGVLYILFRII